jgi:hypothetical protein
MFGFIIIMSYVLTDCILIDAYYIDTAGMTHTTVVIRIDYYYCYYYYWWI